MNSSSEKEKSSIREELQLKLEDEVLHNSLQIIASVTPKIDLFIEAVSEDAYNSSYNYKFISKIKDINKK